VGINCLFDKRDNCFQASINQIAIKTDNHKTTIKRLFVALRERHLVADVVDISGKQRVMINPLFMLPKDVNNYYYMKAQYNLGSAQLAWAYINVCILSGWLCDPLTGEVVKRYDNKNMYLWRHGYTSTDKNKRRTNKQDRTKDIEIDCYGVTMVNTNERLTPQLLYKLGIKSAYID
jgi:hypothetical protein